MNLLESAKKYEFFTFPTEYIIDEFEKKANKQFDFEPIKKLFATINTNTSLGKQHQAKIWLDKEGKSIASVENSKDTFSIEEKSFMKISEDKISDAAADILINIKFIPNEKHSLRLDIITNKGKSREEACKVFAFSLFCKIFSNRKQELLESNMNFDTAIHDFFYSIKTE